MKTPKILVFTVPAWNSKVGANSWEALLEPYDRETIANICIRDELPDSKVCSRYFVISEDSVIKSLFNRKIRTGWEVHPAKSAVLVPEAVRIHNMRYQKMRRRRRTSMLLLRELIWKFGRWKTRELDEFLDDFKPDIILHSMDGYIHLNRVVEYAIRRTGASAVGYIWDDNFTYKQSDDIGYKIYRFFQRNSLKKLARMTDAFFAISDMTKKEADEFFQIDCHLLTKPLNTIPVVDIGEIELPVRMLYTGNLLIGRDRSLAKIVRVLKRLPKGLVEIDIYTQTELEDGVKADIECDFCRIRAPIPQSEALKKQKEADLLLFLEDIDGADARIARLSFSTKITDYLSSGRAILAVGNKDTAPMQYFIQNNAALTASSEDEIEACLKKVLAQPEILHEYAQSAALSGMKNHSRDWIHNTFDSVLTQVTKKQHIR